LAKAVTSTAAKPSVTPFHLTLMMPSNPLAVGTSFRVPVMLSNLQSVSAVPLHINYDASKFTLLDVTAGELVQGAGAVTHRDDGAGLLTINASTTMAMNGAGAVCYLEFKANAAGTGTMAATSSMVDGAGQLLTKVDGNTLSIQVK
jgi:hypothetical protein